MSKAETPVERRIFRAVSDSVAYIPTKSDSEIASGISHAKKITITGRLSVMEVLYLSGWTMAM